MRTTWIHKFYLLTLIVVTSFVCAQDTINFKVTVSSPPKTVNQARFSKGYTTPNQARLDLFDATAKPIVGIPNNYTGTQAPPLNCTNYFGICTYNGNVSFNVGEQTRYLIAQSQFNDIGFVQAEIPTPMVKKEYNVTFKVSLADFSGHATSGWGVYFSDQQITDSMNFSTSVTPQISFPGIIKDKKGWTELSFKYKTTGKEKFVIIGCFSKGYGKEEVLGGKDFAMTKAYYYVSDIRFIEIPEDRDKDGVWDIKDRCPDDFGLAEFNGCPDTDSDGIPDPDDACPKIKGIPAFNGCPDTDGDGIEDSKDKCPTVAGKIEDGGCPVDENEKIGKDIQNVVNGIKFESGKDAIPASYFEVLDDMATVIKSKPFLSISVNEFIDDEATDAAKARTLSSKRATNIILYLVSKGCNPEMIKYIGNPVEPTKSGTDTNNSGRRVEIKQ